MRIGSENYAIQVTAHRDMFEPFVKDLVSAIHAQCNLNFTTTQFYDHLSCMTRTHGTKLNG